MDVPFELRSRPVYSQALWTDRPGTLSAPPPSCPVTPGPGLYVHDPVARYKMHNVIQLGESRLLFFHHISVEQIKPQFVRHTLDQ